MFLASSFIGPKFESEIFFWTKNLVLFSNYRQAKVVDLILRKVIKD
jgi:hypothetical protein